MDEFVVKTLSELVEFIKGASPALWAIARQQVLGNMVSCILWFAISIGVIYACVTWCKWAHKKEKAEETAYRDREDYEFAKWSAVVIGVVFVLVALILLTHAIRLQINPDYYAIQILSGLLR